MTAISQRIPNLLGGVSQQADSRKQATQLRSSLNTFPDPTFGLIKRSGAQFVAELKNAGGTVYSATAFTNAKWFTILRDNSEKYLCCIKSGSLYIWDLLTGAPKTVTYSGTGSSYLTSGTVPDDFHALSINDYTCITNRKSTVTAQATPGAWVRNRAFLSVKAIVYNSSYNITINASSVSYSTGASGSLKIVDVTAGIVSAINAIGGGISATAIGPGVLVTGTSAFSISATGGQAGDALEVFQQSVPNVSKLPSQCSNGYTVLVSNTSGEEDDYYAAFVADNGSSGPGTWQETISPTVSPGLSAATMPHQLVRNANGTFTFGPVAWENRLVGNDDSNPHPSFVGTAIRQLFFYRNRLGALTANNVILSQSGDYFNFYGQSALTSVDSDPIDVTTSTTRPASLGSVQPTTQGLILFGSSEQFIVSSSTDSLTPASVLVKSLSRYQVDTSNEPADLGITSAFLTKSPSYSRVFEMETLGSSENPFIQDITKTVPEWLPPTIDQVTGSGQSSLLALADSTSRYVYLFTFISNGQKRLFESWCQWQLSGNVQHQVIENDVYWCVTKQYGSYAIQRVNIVQSPETSSIQKSDGSYVDPRLDMWSLSGTKSYVTGYGTKVYLPYIHTPPYLGSSSFRLTIVVGDQDDLYPGVSSNSNGAIYQPSEVVQDGGGYYVFIPNLNLTSENLLVGYTFNMSVELPTIFYRTGTDLSSTEYTSYLSVARIKFNFGLSGDIGFTVKAAGRSDWDSIAGNKLANYYRLNDIPFTKNSTFTLPIYQRSENFTVLITSDSPFPVAIDSYTWEGNYSNRSYTRK